MKPNILNILISVVITLGILVGVFYFIPIGMFENPLNVNSPLGTTVTTINGSDTLSGSRTTINNNFTALNNGKIEISTTSLPLITTLAGLTTASNLSSIGSIVSGAWTATPIGVTYGGTGTTSPSLNLLMLGNTTSGFKTVNGFGTTGQFLTSNGVNSAPTWQTSSVDQSIAYTWTGLHTFNTLGAIFNASTTFTSTSTFTLDVSVTRNFVVSGKCTGCAANGYEVISASGAGPNGAVTATSTVWATCSAGKHVISGGGNAANGKMAIIGSYASSTTGWSIDFVCHYSTGCSGETVYAKAICVNN